jgi:predicted nucleic acid-binding protein
VSRKAVFDAYINLAIAAAADYLASRDKDLLDLMQDLDFTTRFPGIRVLDPVSLLREIELEREDDQVRQT